VTSDMQPLLKELLVTGKKALEDALNPTFAMIDERLTANETALQGVQASLKTLSKLPDKTAIAMQVSAINTSLVETKTKLISLEKAILSDPPKAIELPLLRKDLDNAKEHHTSQMLE